MNTINAKKIGSAYIAEGDIIKLKLGYVAHDIYHSIGNNPEGRIISLGEYGLDLDMSAEYHSKVAMIKYDDIIAVSLKPEEK